MSAPNPEVDLAALLRAVIEVPPRPVRIRQRRPVICVEVAAGEQPPPRAELRERAYQAADEALSQVDARPARPGDAQRGTVRGLLTAAIGDWRLAGRVPTAFPTFDAVCRALDAELSSSKQARGLLLGGRPEILKDLGGWLGLIGAVLALSQSPWAASFAVVLAGAGYAGLVCVLVALVYAVVPKLRAAWRLRLLWRATGQRGWWMWKHLAQWHPGPSRAELADQLLAHAVLHDLRRAYGRPFRLGGWPPACPVLLLPAEPAALPLAILLDAQLATARSPLVLVTAGTVDRAAGEPALGPAPWLHGPGGRPGRIPAQPAVWRVQLPVAPAPPSPVRLRGRRLWESPLVHWSVVGVLLVTGAGFVVSYASAPACEQSWEIPRNTTQVIGYRLCGQPFSDPDKGAVPERLRKFQQHIFAENARVDQVADGESRPVLTLAAITALTTTGDGASVMAEAEGLAGVYAAQHTINHQPGDHPLLKVAVANAGANGAHLDLLLKNHLNPLFARTKDAVLGATITVNSTRTVKRALGQLKDQPLTLVTPTMTADDIGAGVPGFFQMITPNAQQAKLVVDYVRSVYRGRRLIDFYRAPSDPTTAREDLYVETLAQQLALAAKATVGSARPVEFDEKPWALGERLEDYCTGRDVLFFGGRYLHLGEFLTQLSRDCKGGKPPVVADDSSSRLLSDREGQQQLPADVPIALATKSIPLDCAKLSLPSVANATAPGLPVAPRAAFRDSMRAALKRCDPNGGKQLDDEAGLAGGWAAGSYDAVRVLFWALSAAQRPGLPARQIADDARRRLREGPVPFGVNSQIVFNAERVAAGRRISLYCLWKPSVAFAGDASPASRVIEVMRDGRSYPDDGQAPSPSACRAPGAR